MKHWLLAIFVIALLLLIYLITSDSSSWISDIAGSLFGETAGAVVTIILIEKIYRRIEEEKRSRIEKAALRNLRYTLVDLVNLFWKMRRAGANTLPPEPITSITDAIATPQAIDDMCHLDFYSDAGMIPAVNWFTHVSQYFTNIHLPAIRRIIDSYATSLSADLIENLEDINSSPLFCRYFTEAHAVPIALDTIKSPIPKHCALLADWGEELSRSIGLIVQIISHHNRLCPENPIEFGPKDMKEKESPLFGTGRVPDESYS